MDASSIFSQKKKHLQGIHSHTRFKCADRLTFEEKIGGNPSEMRDLGDERVEGVLSFNFKDVDSEGGEVKVA